MHSKAVFMRIEKFSFKSKLFQNHFKVFVAFLIYVFIFFPFFPLRNASGMKILSYLKSLNQLI